MLILSWNCRGLRNISTVRNLRAFLRACNPQFAFLTETLIGESDALQFYNTLGFDNFYYIPAIGRSGGSVILWNNDIEVEVLRADKNVFHCRIHNIVGKDWDLLCVYGHPQHHLRNRFWFNLSQYASQIANPWCIVGDLNAISNLKEKKKAVFKQ